MTMLFAVRMDVNLPVGIDPGERATLLARERAYCQELQRAGKWRHIWRITGHHASVSVFEVNNNDELHDILWGLPLFQYLSVQITPLNLHPADLAAPVRSGVTLNAC